MDPTPVIRNKLSAATYSNESPSCAFIPYADLRDIWREDRRLADFVNHKRLGLNEDQFNTAKQSLLRTISILVDIGWDDWLRFKEIFFPTDATLARPRRDENITEFTRNDLQDPSFFGDDHLRIDAFMQKRWVYCPLVLMGGKVMELDSQPGCEWRLPFVKSEPCGSGSSGNVTKETIAREQYIPHIQGDPSTPLSGQIRVARKRFPTRNYRRELNHLKLLRKSLSTHNAIVQDLVTVIMHDDAYILSPLADMDLEELLSQNCRRKSSDLCLRDLISEAAKLADALDFLHRGIQPDDDRRDVLCHMDHKPSKIKLLCHMDLKPANILVYNFLDPSWIGKWKITDFGISRTTEVGDIFPASRMDAAHKTAYSAPEDDALPESDIWSFGCILVRVVAFGLDPQELKELDMQQAKPETPNDRTDHFCRGPPPRLNSYVKAWIERLPVQYSGWCDQVFLTEMKKLLLSMLAIKPPQNRPSASRVRAKLQNLAYPHHPVSPPPTPHHPVSPPTTPHHPVSPPRTPPDRPRPSGSPVDPIVSPGTEEPPVEPRLPLFDVVYLVALIERGEDRLIREYLQHVYFDLEKVHDGKRPLFHAIQKGKSSIIAVLLELKPDLNVETPDSSGQTPLVLAVRKGNAEVVKALLKSPGARAGIDQRSAGMTPLMVAAKNGYTNVVSVLLDHGADCDILSEQGDSWTCLHYAVFNADSGGELIDVFNGWADFNKPNPGQTPLMLYCSSFIHFTENEQQSLSKLHALVRGRAKVNQSCNGVSPLEVAVHAEKKHLAEALLKEGAILPENFSTTGLSKEMKNFVARVQPSCRQRRKSSIFGR